MEVLADCETPEFETFEQVLAGLREVHAMQKEVTKQINKTSIQMEKSDRKFEKMRREVGSLSNRFGELAEHLVAPGIVKKFQKMGIKVEKASKNIEIWKPDMSRILTEIDIFIENGEVAIAVEVKSSMKEKYLDEFFKKMEILRQYADRKQDKRKYLGAIAAAIINDEQRQQILNEGIYLIEQTGDTMMINIPEGFKPREW